MNKVNTPVYATWKNNTHKDWWKDPGLRQSALYSFILYLGFFIGGYDGSYLGGLQALDTWNTKFDTPSGNTLGLISAVAYMPPLALAPVIPWAADKFGRRPVIIAASLICIVGAIVGACANNLGTLIAGRVVVGISFGFTTNSTICLLSELAHPRMRGITVALYLTTYHLGSVVAAWTTFGTVFWASDWGWRLPTLLQALGPVILALCAIFVLPESPRWQIANGHHDAARTTLERIHANGATDDELVNNEIEEINNSLALERSAGLGSWLSLVKTKGNRRRMGVILLVGSGSQLLGNSLVSYYMAPILRTLGITNSVQINAINGSLAIWNYGFAIVGASLVDRVGRRPLWLISTSACLVGFSIVAALSATFDRTGSSAVGGATVCFLFLFYCAYDLGWTPLAFAYTVEILPFTIRAKGMTVMSVTQCTANMFNQWVNPVALEAIGWRYYLCYVGSISFYLIMAFFFFRETRNMTAEEVGLLFDNDDVSAVEHLAEGTKHQVEHVENASDTK